eukprot:TRINITY_DN298_c1_g1_i5.p4 TRINITY_DN298_c1_g1~~TRINITY_DN298_c1_g1_i5.p4  ORF type:complete len:182 (+),score=22.76 TRINITY_DN298_c1_g1_i5:1458-2003(+)
MAYLMWLQRKVERGEASRASAHQYLIFRAMSSIDIERAFRRSLAEGTGPTKQRNLDVGPQAVERILQQRPATMYHVALAFQWATAARFVDLMCLGKNDVRDMGDNTLVIFRGGKTDRRSVGQPLLVPSAGRFISFFKTHRHLLPSSSRTEGGVFLGLTRQAYNAFLRKHMSKTTHDNRHAA